MALELRRIGNDIARQALTHHVLGWAPLKEGERVLLDPKGLQCLARAVPVPELLPYRQVYINIYADDDARFYAEIDEATRGRRQAPRTVPH